MKLITCYIPVPVKKAVANGVVLISTHKVTITDEKAKLEFTEKQHLKEVTNVYVLTQEEFDKEVKKKCEAIIRNSTITQLKK